MAELGEQTGQPMRVPEPIRMPAVPVTIPAPVKEPTKVPVRRE